MTCPFLSNSYSIGFPIFLSISIHFYRVYRDTLITIGWLDLNKGPQVLHVPDMAGRYYALQLTDPSNNTNFAYVGKRTTGTEAGDYIIVGPPPEGSRTSGHDADLFAEQFGADYRARAG